eukprot:scaffold190917_cov51-Prasinocladus_malaysianus.AAC.1
MPRGDVKRRPCGDVYGDYDPIRHEWRIEANNPQMFNKVDGTIEQKKQVPLPEAMGDYDPIYEMKWTHKPRHPAPDLSIQGAQHEDREYKPELRTKLRVLPPAVPGGA